MRVILTDLTDHPNPELRGHVLRVLDNTNCLVLQGNMYGRNGRECCERIAAGLGVALEYVGRPARGAQGLWRWEPSIELEFAG